LIRYGNTLTQFIDLFDMNQPSDYPGEGDLKHLRLLAGNSNPDLFQKIAKWLNFPLTNSQIDQFSNSEIRVRILENIRRKTAVILQTGTQQFSDGSGYSINDYLMETLLMINACRLSSVDEIVVIMPSYPYARQDKKDTSRTPISGKLVADLLQTAGVSRLVTMDLHASQIAGFFSIPVDNLYSVNLLADYLQSRFVGVDDGTGTGPIGRVEHDRCEKLSKDNLVLVSPDNGGIKRMEALAQRVSLPTVTMHKVRDYIQKNTVNRTILVGDAQDITGKSCIIVDDICDTAGTVCQACQTLMEFGAKDVRIMVVHGILSGPAIDRINKLDFIKEVIVTNSLPQVENQKRCSKLKVIDVSSLLGETIQRLCSGGSISELFD